MVTAATFGPSAATAGGSGHSGDAPYRGKVISLMRHMSLEQKVGQLFVIEVAGRDADNVSDAAKTVNQRLYGVDTPAQAIAKYQPGGVIYYTTRQACSGCPSDDNIGDPAQVATLSNGLQTASLAQPAHIPLQISVDQEGGALVARFGPPTTQMPGAMALGADRLRGGCPHLGDGDRHGAEGGRGHPGLRRRLRRQHQPEQPCHRGPLTSAATPRWSRGSSPARSRASTTRVSQQSPSTSPVTATPEWTATSGFPS